MRFKIKYLKEKKVCMEFIHIQKIEGIAYELIERCIKLSELMSIENMDR